MRQTSLCSLKRGWNIFGKETQNLLHLILREVHLFGCRKEMPWIKRIDVHLPSLACFQAHRSCTECSHYHSRSCCGFPAAGVVDSPFALKDMTNSSDCKILNTVASVVFSG